MDKAPNYAVSKGQTGLRAQVVVVDDEPALAEVFSHFLQSCYQVKSFTRAEDALEHLRLSPADLLVSDLCMPGLNGLQLIRAAKKLIPNIKVLLISGLNPHAWPLDGAEGLAQVDAFLAKPMSLQNLERCCRRLLSADGAPARKAWAAA